MLAWKALACVVVVAAGSCVGEPEAAYSSRLLGEFKSYASKVRVWKDKLVGVTGPDFGVAVIDLQSKKILSRNKDITVYDAIFVERESKLQLICGGDKYDEELEESSDGTIWSVDPISGESKTLIRGLKSYVRRLTLSPAGDKIGILASSLPPTLPFAERVFTQEIRLWDLKSPKSTLVSKGHYSEIMFTPLGETIVAVDSSRDTFPGFGTMPGRRDIVGIELATGKDETWFSLEPYEALCQSRDGKTLIAAMGGKKPAIDLWDKQKRKKIASFPKTDVTFSRVAISETADLFAFADQKGVFELWKRGETKPFLSFQHDCSFHDICFIDNSSWVCLDSLGKVWHYSLKKQ